MCLGADKSAQRTADLQRQNEIARQGRIEKGREKIDEAFMGFDDTFYAQRGQDYQDYAKPQIQDQYGDALKQLRLALARSNLTNSSVAATKRAQLQKDLDKATSQMAQTADKYSQQAKQAVDTAKSELQNQNMSLADPSMIAQSAINRADVINQLPQFNPITKIFNDATYGLATQMDLERRGKNRYDMPFLFDTGSSGKVIS